MSDQDGTLMLFMMNDNYADGQGRPIDTTFGHEPFVNDAYLYNYSSYGGGFYVFGSQIANGEVIIPPGGYFVFSWRTPEESDLWRVGGGKPLTIYQNGQEAGTVSVIRRDGPDGDENFNPYNLPNRGYATNETATPYTYKYTMPRVTSPTNLRFVARVDGSAANVLMKLDGGVDINSHMGMGHTNETVGRDNAPGIWPLQGTDTFLGYEETRYRHRQHEEKFAAKDASRNKIGSAGAETYLMTIGTSGFTTNRGDGVNNWSRDEGAAWVYHDPFDQVTGGTNSGTQFSPLPQSAAGVPVTMWVKVGYGCDVGKAYIYYTTDGVSYPEGAGGEGIGNTKVVEMNYHHSDAIDGSGFSPDWWRGVLPALPSGTKLRYKISAYRVQGGGCGAPYIIQFPVDGAAVDRKLSRMGVWEITNFNAAAAVYKPHNDYGASVTGLVEGFHMLKARAFLDRDGRAALYNTFAQSFYYDAARPGGAVAFPANNGDDLLSQEYGWVIRTDPTVQEVWYNIDDSNPLNDDGQTGKTEGNGTNALGQTAWAQATRVVPTVGLDSAYPDEWRFTYRNIPASGTASVQVRLRELSSSTNLNQSDVAGHFTTLTRSVDTLAPAQALFVAFPPDDGDVVDTNYVLKVYFSKSLADGTDEPTLKSRFAVRINGATQSTNTYSISYNENENYHALAVTLPNLYNGDEDYLHEVQITHLTGGSILLQASRLVKAAPASTGPYVAIVTPPEVDSVGKPFEIILPDVAVPTAQQRQYTILVESGLAISNLWIEFVGGTGHTRLLDSVDNPLAGRLDVNAGNVNVIGRDVQLSGTVSVTLSNTTVTGSGTAFLTQVKPGNRLRIGTNTVTVSAVQSNTILTLTSAYVGPAGSGLAAFVRPAFDVELQTGQTLKVGTNLSTVASVSSSSNLTLTTAYPGPTASGQIGYRVEPNPSLSGNRLRWSFLWTNMTAGSFTFRAQVDTDADTNSVEAFALRNTRVVLRQVVTNNPASDDDDNDGLSDTDETTSVPLPAGNSEGWSNGDVHKNLFSGRTDPLSPDSDGDGVADATELGLQLSIATSTVVSADTNGDGFNNFISDAHAPLFNTTDNWWHPRYDLTKGRLDLLEGTVTDAGNPDTDFDSIIEGMEDLNRNGRVEIGLLSGGVITSILTNPPTIRATSRIDGNALPTNARWLESDPNNSDTDGDGALDGQEDMNGNGRLDIGLVTNGVTNVLGVADLPLYGTNLAGVLSRAVKIEVLTNRYNLADLRWLETDPLLPDTDGDGLLDGWERQFGLDALDNGTLNLRTGGAGDPEKGASGDPDNDTFDNATEFLNGTHPLVPDNVPPPPEGSITVGRGPAIGMINGITYYQEFMDWTWDDLRMLDEYEGDGSNNQQGDIYPGYDGFDSSRDIVAFYMRDGGAIDNKIYFRLDFNDLTALAEQANLDIYVAIDIGSPTAGERVLPDDVDTLTDMRWEAVVAVYDSAAGTVYVDTNPGANTTLFGQSLSSFGVVSQPAAYLGAYFNAELDSVEFAISRQALTDIGWNGIASNLNLQVFTTRDGTCNGCVDGGAGAGDIGGRSDIRDSIVNDYIAEDYFSAQAGLAGSGSVLVNWIAGGNHASRAKVAVLVHGNQANQPGSSTQRLINDQNGAGYHRVILGHEVFAQPLNLHITPTLASSIEWARVDTNQGPFWVDGPAFNAWIAQLIQTNIIYLLASTYSDHMMPYFPTTFNQENIQEAGEVLSAIYGVTFTSNSVFWTPERLFDEGVFSDVQAAGYHWTVIDQNTHLWNWFGRTDSLGENGYSLNRIHGVGAFVINNLATDFRFSNLDGGPNTSLRNLMSRRARGAWERLTTLFMNWEDFASNSQADAYDRNLRWMANRPWIRLVGLEEITTETLDLSGNGMTSWSSGVVDRGSPSLSLQSHNWLNHATGENYDHWYYGSAIEEGLAGQKFNVRSGVQVPKAYGEVGVSGTVQDAWALVQGITETGLARLARTVLFASTFQTAFHVEDNNDLSRWSTGDYIYPAISSNTLQGFARRAQAQSRFAAIYSEVDTWAAIAGGMTTTLTMQVDADLDGENEYVLANDRVFALFERIGGRMVGAWARDPSDGLIYQVMGNHASAPGVETELEGNQNLNPDGSIAAFRTSGFKDWVQGGATYVNDLYSIASVANGWQLTSPDGRIIKTITLAPSNTAMQVNYQVSTNLNGGVLGVRHGLSLNLLDLLAQGQATLGYEDHLNGVMTLANLAGGKVVRAVIGYQNGANNTGFNRQAVDDNPGGGYNFATVTMRNQPQTHQVELIGTNTFSFTLSLEALSVGSDWEQWALDNELDPFNPATAGEDADGDKVSNWEEYIANTDPQDEADYLAFDQQINTSNGMDIRFATSTDRRYFVWYSDTTLIAPDWVNATTSGISGDGNIYIYTDTNAVTPPQSLLISNRFYRIGVELNP
ncbi:MAG: hypothetical protein KDL31_09830 [Kiritimatiellae bacterium]|nr:hypothetical protein [Kiritimatiellia bacterium]